MKTISKMIITGCLLLLSFGMQAKTNVFIQNNTIRILYFKTESNLGKQHWTQHVMAVRPGERKKLLSFARWSPIKNGKHYHFNTKVTSVFGGGKKPITIRQQLQGTPLHSHMWQSIDGHDWEDNDGAVHNKAWVIGTDKTKFFHEVKVNIKYWSFGTGGDSDIEYAFQEEYPLPIGNYYEGEAYKNHLDVLSYNIYMRPTGSIFINGQSIRAKKIPVKVRGYDVVCFQEAFDDDIRKEMTRLMRENGYPHKSRILGRDGKDWPHHQDGGVIFYSKHPIISEGQKNFNDVCSGDDCISDKGVLYVAINKEGKIYHLFGTHMNNGNLPIQKQQLSIIKNFIDSKNISKKEPVIICGDFNLNRYTPDHRKPMINTLNARDLGEPIDFKYSLSYATNKFHGGGTGGKLVDHVLVSNNHELLKSGFQQVRMLRSNMEWKEHGLETASWELSDHYAVYASLDFSDHKVDLSNNDNKWYTGIWLKDNRNKYKVSKNKNWDAFIKDWKSYSKNGYRLRDVEIQNGGTFDGVFEQGKGGYSFYSVGSWKAFAKEWEKQSKKGLRLIDFETFKSGKKTNFVGVYQASNRGYSLYRISSWKDFLKQCNTSHKQGLRLIDFHTDVENGVRFYTGVWLSGKYGNYIKRHTSWDAFTKEWKRMASKNYRLVDFETFKQGKKNYYIGVYKSGKQGYYLWRQNGWVRFNQKIKELNQKGYRLIDVEQG